jgi:hypothetical protein
MKMIMSEFLLAKEVVMEAKVLTVVLIGMLNILMEVM